MANGNRTPNRALLQGKLRCASCDCSMIGTYTSKGSRRYHYYVCVNAQKRGWKNCPAPSIPASEIDRFLIEELRDRLAGMEGEATGLVWDELPLAEQRSLVEQSVERVEYDGNQVSITFKDEPVPIPQEEAA